MSKKSDSSISIRQLVEVSLVIVISLVCGIEIQKNAKHIDVQVSNAVQEQYEEALVPNDDEDIIHHEERIYLEKKEITNNVSRGSNIDRNNKKEIINSNNYEVNVENQEKTENEEEIIINKEEKNEQSEKNASTEEPPTEYKEVLEAKATAYCLCKKCCGKSETHPEYGVTASGLKIVPGTGMKVIAVDPNVIPLGTKVYVEGLNGAKDYGYAVAADTGSAIKNLKIDLYMESHEKAYQWGRKQVKIYVIE